MFFAGPRSEVWQIMQVFGADMITLVGSRGSFSVIPGLRPAVKFPRTRCRRLAICVRGCRDSSEGKVSCCRRECKAIAGSEFGGGRFRRYVGERQFAGSPRCAHVWRTSWPDPVAMAPYAKGFYKVLHICRQRCCWQVFIRC